APPYCVVFPYTTLFRSRTPRPPCGSRSSTSWSPPSSTRSTACGDDRLRAPFLGCSQRGGAPVQQQRRVRRDEGDRGDGQHGQQGGEGRRRHQRRTRGGGGDQVPDPVRAAAGRSGRVQQGARRRREGRRRRGGADLGEPQQRTGQRRCAAA